MTPRSDCKCGKYRQEFINALIKIWLHSVESSRNFYGHLPYGILPKLDEKYGKYGGNFRKHSFYSTDICGTHIRSTALYGDPPYRVSPK
jgi:hypothetical protein